MEVNPRAARTELLVFFALAFALSWAASAPFVFRSAESWTGTYTPLVYLARFGPTLAAVLLAHFWLEGTLGGLLRPLIPSGRHWWLILLALAGPPVVGFAVVGVAPTGLELDAEFESLTPGLVLGAFFSRLLLGGGLGEEPGWRGFALPRMQGLRGPVVASLLLGLVWALWCLPGFFIETSDRSGTPWFLHSVLVVSYSVLITWVYNRGGGNLFACMVLRASLEGTDVLLRAAFLRLNIGSSVHWWLAGVYAVLAVAVIAATRGRLGLPARSPGTTAAGPAG